MLSHNSLQNYYMTLFELTQQKHLSLTEIEEMMPFELTLYIELILAKRKREEDATNA